MPRYLVPVAGNVVVTAADEASAKERANVYMAYHGVAFIKSTTYGIEIISDDAVVPAKNDE